MIRQIRIPMRMDCMAATAAPSLSFSPMRLATMAVVAIESPSANATICDITTSVNPMVAVASLPSFATKKMSTRANNPSINISSTIGIDRSMIARSILPEVYSVSAPEMAWRKSFRKWEKRLMGRQK